MIDHMIRFGLQSFMIMFINGNTTPSFLGSGFINYVIKCKTGIDLRHSWGHVVPRNRIMVVLKRIKVVGFGTRPISSIEVIGVLGYLVTLNGLEEGFLLYVHGILDYFRYIHLQQSTCMS